MNSVRLDRFSFKKLSRRPVAHHMLDSGDHYGRNYQRKLETEVTVDVSYNEYHDHFDVVPNIPLGAWLDERFTLDVEATKFLRSFEGHRMNSRDAAEEYAKRKGLTNQFEAGQWCNSYNHETDLDQAFQDYRMRDESDEMLFFIETHNGCDIRGGYSQVVVARGDEDSAYDYTVLWMADEAKVKGVVDAMLLHEFQQHDCEESLKYLVERVCGKGVVIMAATKVGAASVHLILSDGNEVTVRATNGDL